MNAETQRLKRALKILLTIVKSRPNAQKVVPYVQRIERETASQSSQQAELERILRMAVSLGGKRVLKTAPRSPRLF
jgi:hypothetical protein